MNISFDDYFLLLDLLKKKFPKKGAKIGFWDALIYLVLSSLDGSDDVFFKHSRTKEGFYILTVEGRKRKIRTETMTKAIDHLSSLGLCSVEKGYFFKKSGFFKAGKTILDARKIREVLGGGIEIGSFFHEPTTWSTQVKIDGVSFGDYSEFRRMNGDDGFVEDVFRRVSEMTEVYRGLALSFPQERTELPLETAEEVFSRYVSSLAEKSPEKLDFVTPEAFREIFQKAREVEAGLRTDVKLTAVVRNGRYGRIYSKLSNIRKFLVPMIRIDGERTYEADGVSCIPQLILQKEGEWVSGTDVYEEVRLSLANEHISREKCKKMILLGLNCRSRNHLMQTVFFQSRGTRDYRENWKDAHKSIVDGSFLDAVERTSPALRKAFFSGIQNEIITIEAELFQNVLTKIFRAYEKRLIYRFDSLICPVSLDPAVLQNAVDQELSRILGRKTSFDMKFQFFLR